MNRVPQQEGWPNFAVFFGRKWRGRLQVATWLGCAGAAYFLVFHSEFRGPDGGDHVFSGARRWHRRQLDALFGGARERDGARLKE